MMIKKTQSITEYTVVIACVVVSLIVMQAYFRRGLSGKVKSSVDRNLGSQFDPYKGDLSEVTSRSSDTVEVTKAEWDEEEERWDDIAYSVTGPQSISNDEGDDIIEADPDRKPLKITNYKDSTIDWQELDLGDK